MLEGLLTLDEKMQVKPALATSYEVMSPTKVRFKLRPGVKFHDGTPFNAAAVKFTFDRALKGTPPARWASLAGSLDGAEVVDDLTVDIVTKEPYGPILRTLAMYCMGIVSPDRGAEDGRRLQPGARSAPGPFKFVEWKTNTHVIIERNPDYWGDKALVDRVIFKVVPEEGARMIALQTGDADMVLFPSPAQLPALRKDAKFTVHETTGIRVVFAGLHAGQPPLDDVRVRQALLHAVDRKAILDNIMEGSAGPARGVLAPGVFGYKDMQLDQLYPVRPRQGQGAAGPGRLDAGAGRHHAEGRAAAVALVAGRARAAIPKDGEITEAIQAMFKEVGVEAKVQVLEWAAVFQQVRGNPLNHHMFTLGWVTSNADADYSLYALFHCKQVPPDGLEHLALREPAGRHAGRAGAPQPEPDGAREALRRGAGHPRQGDGVDPGLHDQGDHRDPRQREGLHHPPGRVQPGALEDLARQVAACAPGARRDADVRPSAASSSRCPCCSAWCSW